MKFKRMGHAALHVSDLDRSLKFYQEVLGLKPQWVGDADWANLTLGPDDLSLVRKAGFRHPPHLGLRVDSRADLEEMHRHLKNQGVKVQAIKIHRDASESFYFSDPDGNILEALFEAQSGGAAQ